MNTKKAIFPLQIFFLLTIFFGCKKDTDVKTGSKQNTDTLLIGFWQVKLVTLTQYDSVGNFKQTDTIILTDMNGTPIKVFEQFRTDGNFFAYRETITDTISKGTYSKNANNLLIKQNGLYNEFSNRTIIYLDSTNLEVFQYFANKTPKQKWTQKYVRNKPN